LVLDAEEIFGEAAVGRRDHDDAGVRELIEFAVGAGHADVVESGGLRERGDGRLRPCEEVDGIGGGGGRVNHGEEVLLLHGGGGGGVGRVDAGDHDVIFMACVEAAGAEGFGHAVQ